MNMMVDFVIILFVVIGSIVAEPTTKIRTKSSDGGPDMIYEMVGDIMVNQYREGVRIFYFSNCIKLTHMNVL